MSANKLVFLPLDIDVFLLGGNGATEMVGGPFFIAIGGNGGITFVWLGGGGPLFG